MCNDTNIVTTSGTPDPVGMRTLKLLLISSENPDREDFAMYMGRRYATGARLAINDVKQGTEYGEWSIDPMSDFDIELIYVPCGLTGNTTGLVDGKMSTIFFTYIDLECVIETAQKYVHDPDLLGVMSSETDLVTPSLLSIMYLNKIPVITLDTPENNLSYENKITMSPTYHHEIDVMISFIKHHGWKRIGIVYDETFNSFGFSFGKKATESSIQLQKYVVTNSYVLDDVIEQIRLDDIRILVFHGAITGSVYIFKALEEFVKANGRQKYVLLTTSSFKGSYVSRHDACTECLKGVTTIVDAYKSSNESFNKRLTDINDEGGNGVDAAYSYTGVSQLEYKNYDAWMTILNHYRNVSDRLMAGDATYDVTKSLNRIGSDVSIDGIHSYMSFDSDGNIIKDFQTLNYYEESKRTIITGTYSVKTSNYVTNTRTIFADGTINIPVDREPNVVRHLSDGNKTAAIIVFCLSFICSTVAASLILMYRKEQVVKAHGYMFIVISVIGACIGSFSTMLDIMLEDNFHVCILPDYFRGISFTCIFGSLLLKNWKVRRILTSHYEIISIGMSEMVGKLSVLLFIELSYHTLFKRFLSTTTIGLVHISDTSNEYRYSCSTTDDPWWTISINIYRLILALVSTYFAVKTLRCNERFHESVYVIHFTLWTIPVALCVAIISTIIEDDINAVFMIKYLFINIGAAIYSLCIVVPILFEIGTVRKNMAAGTTRDSSGRLSGGKGAKIVGLDNSTESTGDVSKIRQREIQMGEIEVSIETDNSTLSDFGSTTRGTLSNDISIGVEGVQGVQDVQDVEGVEGVDIDNVSVDSVIG